MFLFSFEVCSAARGGRVLCAVAMAFGLAATVSGAHAAAPAATSRAVPEAAPVQASFESGVVVAGPQGKVTEADLEAAVREIVPASEQAGFWSRTDSLQRFAQDMYVQRVLAAHGERLGLASDASVAGTQGVKRERALARAYVLHEVAAQMPDDAALERYARSEYAMQADRQIAPEQIHARHILLPVAADGSDDAAVKARAEQLIEKLRAGADFAALAKNESSDKGSGARGGDLGWFARGRMVAPFEDAAFALQQPGELSAPIKSRFGWHVIELLGKRAPRQITFEELRGQLMDGARAKLDQRVRAALWQQAQQDSHVNEAALQAVAARHAKP